MTTPERPLTPGEALAKLFMENADRGANAANDALVKALRHRARVIQTLADTPPRHHPDPHPTIEGLPPMTAEKSHRFALTGQDPEGRNRTVILWQEAELIDGRVVRRVVVTLDATMTTATVFTCPEAVEVAQAILAAAQGVTR